MAILFDWLHWRIPDEFSLVIGVLTAASRLLGSPPALKGQSTFESHYLKGMLTIQLSPNPDRRLLNSAYSRKTKLKKTPETCIYLKRYCNEKIKG